MLNKDYPGNESFTITLTDLWYSKNPQIRTSTFKNQQPKIWGF